MLLTVALFAADVVWHARDWCWRLGIKCNISQLHPQFQASSVVLEG